MKILIVYGTVEGQTRKIARFMADILREKSHQVVISNAVENPPAPIDFDAVLIGSSIHMSRTRFWVQNLLCSYEQVQYLDQKLYRRPHQGFK